MGFNFKETQTNLWLKVKLVEKTYCKLIRWQIVQKIKRFTQKNYLLKIINLKKYCTQ